MFSYFFQNVNNNNNNDNNNSNNNNNKNTNENKKRKKRSATSAAINEDLDVVQKLIEQPLSDKEITNDIMNLFLDDFLKGQQNE